MWCWDLTIFFFYIICALFFNDVLHNIRYTIFWFLTELYAYFLDITFFHVLHSSYLNCTWLIENNKYFLTDRITRLIKFWILIIMFHIYIVLCHTQRIYTYILISITALRVKWGRYYYIFSTLQMKKPRLRKWSDLFKVTLLLWDE